MYCHHYYSLRVSLFDHRLKSKRKDEKTPLPPTHTCYWLVWCHDTWSIFLILDWNDIWSIYGFCVSLVPGLNFFKVSHVLTNLIWLRLSEHQLQLTNRWTVRVTPLRQNTWLVLDEVLCKSPATAPIKSNLYLPVPLSRVRSGLCLLVWESDHFFCLFFFSHNILRCLRENI